MPSQRISAGQLRHRVTIETPVREENDLGEIEIPRWKTLLRVWAAIRPASSQETMRAEKIEAQRAHVVTIRYTPTVTTVCRIRWGTRILNISGILDPDERKRELRLNCSEVSSG